MNSEDPSIQKDMPSNVNTKKAKIIIAVSAIVLAAAAVTVALVLLLGGTNITPADVNGMWSITISPEKVDRNNDFGIIGMGFPAVYPVKISLGENGKGTFSLPIFTSQGDDLDAALSGGRITVQGVAPLGLTFYIEGSMKKDKEALSLSGTWRLYDDKSNKDIESGTWTAKRAE